MTWACYLIYKTDLSDLIHWDTRPKLLSAQNFQPSLGMWWWSNHNAPCPFATPPPPPLHFNAHYWEYEMDNSVGHCHIRVYEKCTGVGLRLGLVCVSGQKFNPKPVWPLVNEEVDPRVQRRVTGSRSADAGVTWRSPMSLCVSGRPTPVSPVSASERGHGRWQCGLCCGAR